MKYSMTYNNKKVWSTQSILDQISEAVEGGQRVYASLCPKENQSMEISFDCTDSDNVRQGMEESHVIGDISGKWEAVKMELADQKMPEEWFILTNNNKEMEDNAMGENQNITVTVEEEVMNKGQNVTATEEEKVMDGNKEAVTIKQESKEIVKDNLPEIVPESPYAVLAQKDGYQLNMQICGDMTTMQSEGCKLYLTDMKTGMLYISGSSEITIPRARILSANDHTVMNVLSTFLVNFGDDDKKRAYARAKEYLEAATNITKTPSSRNIQEILLDVVECAKAKALEAMASEKPCDGYKYDEKEGTVAIIASQFQKLLDEIDAGCTKTVFCKKLRLVEQHYGKKIIISNRGGSGYGFNDTNNRRYYKFKMVTFGMVTEEG